MLDKGTRLYGVSVYPISGNRDPVLVAGGGDFGKGKRAFAISTAIATLTLGLALLAAPQTAFAQRSVAGRARRPSICIHDCRDSPDSDSSLDDLKDFDHLMAVQASDQQTAAFATLIQDAQAASTQLQALREILPKAPAALSEHVGSLDQAVEKVGNGSQSFL